MAKSVQVKNLNLKHMAILEFIVTNPMMAQRDIAAHFGVSQSWLSILLHSAMFKERLAQMQDAAFAPVLANVAEKTEAVVSNTLDRLGEAVVDIEHPPTPEFLRKTADTLLAHMTGSRWQGQAPGSTIMQNNFYGHVTKETLIEARAAMDRSLAEPAVVTPDIKTLEHIPDEDAEVAAILGECEDEDAAGEFNAAEAILASVGTS
jgi:hypothetical protein